MGKKEPKDSKLDENWTPISLKTNFTICMQFATEHKYFVILKTLTFWKCSTTNSFCLPLLKSIKSQFLIWLSFFQQHEIHSKAKWRQKSLATNTSTLEKTAGQNTPSTHINSFCFVSKNIWSQELECTILLKIDWRWWISIKRVSLTQKVESKWARQSWYYLNFLTQETGPIPLPQNSSPSSRFLPFTSCAAPLPLNPKETNTSANLAEVEPAESSFSVSFWLSNTFLSS